jgi:hypothetical protein
MTDTKLKSVLNDKFDFSDSSLVKKGIKPEVIIDYINLPEWNQYKSNRNKTHHHQPTVSSTFDFSHGNTNISKINQKFLHDSSSKSFKMQNLSNDTKGFKKIKNLKSFEEQSSPIKKDSEKYKSIDSQTFSPQNKIDASPNFNMSKITQMNQSEVDNIYKKVFNKQFNYLINPKVVKKVDKFDLNDADYLYEKNKNKNEKKAGTYIEEKLKIIKTKIFFMKGVFDYSYPQIIVKKMRAFNKIIEEKKKKNEEKIVDKKFKTKLRFSQSDPNTAYTLYNNSLTIQNFSNKTHLNPPFNNTYSWKEYKSNLAKTQIKHKNRDHKLKFFVPLNITKYKEE